MLGACEANDAPPVPYHLRDQPYVDRALASYSGNGRIPQERVDEQVSAVVVHLPTMVCVGLNLKRGMAGGDTTNCYDKVSGKEVVIYVNGE
jgi:hypothetical protein